MGDLDIEAIKARLAASTPGPWRRNAEENIVSDARPGGWFLDTIVVETQFGYAGITDGDYALIAHAPEDIAALLAEVGRLRALPRLTP